MSRKILYAALGLSLAAPTWAADFPTLSDATSQNFLNRYISEQAMLSADDFLQHPAQAATDSCAPSEVKLYEAAGLFGFHAELRPELEKRQKEMRKALRDAGMDPNSGPQTVESNPKISILEIHCKDGKIDGPYKYLVSYDSQMTTNTTIPFGDTVVTGQNITTIHYDRRVHMVYHDGQAESGIALYQLSSFHNETHYDNAAMERAVKKSEKLVNQQAPQMSVTYTLPDGHMASFSPIVVYKAGGLIPHVQSSLKITSMFTYPVDANHSVMETYMGAQPVSISHMRDNKMHGEQITYMENVYRKFKMRLDQVPGMENAREVNLNGFDAIEIKNCYQNGAQVKITPCPAD